MGGFTATKKIACCAVATAVLLVAQVALGFVSGLELVTVLLACFSAFFGVICGVSIAISFSLLRCFIFGFNPAAIVLYLIYYPLFAVIFGLLGKIKDETYSSSPVKICVAVNVLLAVLAVASGLCAGLDIIKTSPLYAVTMRVLLWVICGICGGQLVFVNIITVRIVNGKSGGKALKLLLFTAAACTLTVCFTLLDDVISPLFYGMNSGAALTYFYASFTAMLPQVLCAAGTTLLLTPAVSAALNKACPFCVDKRLKKL